MNLPNLADETITPAEQHAAVAAQWARMRLPARNGVKRMELPDAVRQFVRAGDMLYFGGSMARPNAAMFEVARQFWSTDPRFTLVAPAIANQHAPLIRAGLVSRAISSIQAMTFPTPAPHPLYVAADRDGSVAFENWSLLTLVQRLMAASLGLPFMPTASLAGSDMVRALGAQGVAQLDDPFGSGSQATVVAPLSPDVTFVHGLAADEHGNTLICPPHYDGAWAAYAAGRAVIVTVEQIVSTEYVRNHAEYVLLPGSAVSAVCEVAFGGHPNSLPGQMLPELGGYPDDYEFLEALREAGKTPEGLDAWAAEWITGCRDHHDYLRKLGAQRLQALHGRTQSTGWRTELPALRSVRAGQGATENERHVVLATRVLQARLAQGGISCILAGLGISSLAAWQASMQLAQQGTQVPLMVEAGMYGYVPSPADPFLFNYRNMSGNLMLTDTLTTLGVLTAGPRNRAIGVLGAAQIDAQGHINTTRLPNLLLTGSGGANDIGSGASELLVTIGQSSRRLVQKVDFITTPGHAVATIVTPQAVFRRHPQQGFVLEAVLAQGDATLDELVQAVKSATGWDVTVADTVRIEPEPTQAEIDFARLLDPKGLFLG